MDYGIWTMIWRTWNEKYRVKNWIGNGEWERANKK